MLPTLNLLLGSQLKKCDSEGSKENSQDSDYSILLLNLSLKAIIPCSVSGKQLNDGACLQPFAIDMILRDRGLRKKLILLNCNL